MNDRSSALATILVGTLLAPFALLFSVLLLVPAGWLQYRVLRELSKAHGLVLRKRKAPVAPILVPLVSTAGFVLLAHSAFAAFESAGVILSLVAGGSTTLSLISAPLSFYVPACLDAQATPSVDAALRQWDAVPQSRKVMLVGLRAAPIILATVAWMGTRAAELEAPWPLMVACPYVLGLWFYQWQVLTTYQDTPAAPQNSSIASARWRLMLPAVLATLLALPLLVACALAASRPAPMRHAHANGERIYALTSGHSVPGSDLEIVPAPDGVDVFANGMVTAHVEYGGGCSADAHAEITTREASSGHDIFIHACGRWHHFEVSRTGSRHTTLETRLTRRLGTFALTALLLGLVFLFVALARLLPSLANARRIVSVVRREELECAQQESILEGVLRLPGALKSKRHVLKVNGAFIELALDGDRFRLPLPDSVPCAKGRYEDGIVVSLVGVFSSVSRGHRDATIPWPKRAFLVPGPADEARELWLWKATRISRLAAIASTLILVASYGFLALG